MRTKTMYDVICSKKAKNLKQRKIFIQDQNLKFQPNCPEHANANVNSSLWLLFNKYTRFGLQRAT